MRVVIKRSGDRNHNQEDRVETVSAGGGRFRRRTKAFRRLTGVAALLFALIAIGFGYSALAPTGNTASAGPTDPQKVAAGKQLYDNSCITCHGANLQGVEGRGVPLIGVGYASAYFQLATGRMPATEHAAEMPRKIPVFAEAQIEELSAYVQSVGGGPQLPDGSLRDDAEMSKGAELYRLNCASCHNFTGRGGALSQGKYAPPLDESTDKDMYAAMLSGPESMPVFSDAQLTPNEKKAIISFVQGTKASQSPGGYDLGGFGPAPEGLIAFLVGMGAIVAITLWSGSRS